MVANCVGLNEHSNPILTLTLRLKGGKLGEVQDLVMCKNRQDRKSALGLREMHLERRD